MAALSHVKSNTVGDFTGTVTVFDSRGSTATANATDLVRPVDWNSAHNFFQTLSGNTAGSSTMSGTNLVWQGGNNVTLSASTAAGAATVIVSAANQSVQTQASGNIVGSGFTSTTTAGSVPTATLNSQGLSMAVPAWLTTQTVQTQASGNIAGSGFTSTTTAGTGVNGTHNSAGLSMAFPAWLTTAMASNAATISNVNISAGTTSTNASAFTFANANGLTFGLGTGASAGSITASHNGLTTARASNDAIGLNTAQSNVTWTVNSSGLSLDARGYAGTGTTFNGTNASASMTLNSAGLRLDLSAAAGGGGGGTITAYAMSNTTGASSSVTLPVSSFMVQPYGILSAGFSNGSLLLSTPDPVVYTQLSVGFSTGGNTSGNTGLVTGQLVLAGGNGITLSGSTNGGSQTITISGGGGGGGAALSAGTQSVSTGTVNFANSNGITFGMSNSSQITASYNSTQFAGTGTTFAGANISASMTLNSNGLNLSASVAAPGAAAEQNAFNLLGANTAGNTTATGSTIGLSAINLTLSGTNNSQIAISAPATSSLVGASGISISTAGSTISVYQAPLPYLFLPNQDQITNLSAHANGTMSIQNRLVEIPRTGTVVAIPVNISSVATAANNSSAGINFSISLAIYTEAGDTLSSVSSTTFTNGATWSSNATGSVTGAVFLTAPFNMNMSVGEYYFGVNMSTAATGNILTGAATTSLANTISIMGLNTAVFGAYSWHTLGGGTNQSIGWEEQGLYTGTTAFTGPINLANLSMAGTAAQRANYAIKFQA